MNRWLRLALAGLALLWAPFLYKELTREGPATEQDGVRDADEGLASEDMDEQEVLVAPMPSAPDDQPGEAEREQQGDQEGEQGAARAAKAEANAPGAPAAELAQAAPQVRPSPNPAASGRVDPAHAEGAAEEDGEDDEGAEDEAQEAAEQVPMTASGPLALLRDVFEGETRDALWAADREASLSDFMTGTGMSAESLGDVACRRTVCRMSLVIKPEELEAMGKAFKTFQAKDGPGVAVEPQQTTDGVTRVMLYLPREGYTLNDLAKK